jgi:hypothetical protein
MIAWRQFNTHNATPEGQLATRSRVEGPVMDRLRQLAFDHHDWTPAQIHREMGEDAPSLRTVKRYLRDSKRDDSGAWTIDAAEPDPEAWALVFPVARMLTELWGATSAHL